ncbi:MAG TPA: transglycosylase domain-containing protein, partial [Vicinamibacteria bacterium]|nr:transglycosylase domain-containing protein [Vicinamibacteria bacterium]
MTKRRAVRWAGLAAAMLLAFWLFVPVVPFDDPLSTVVLDRDGELVGASIAADGQWRFGVAAGVPSKFAAAITCFEDRRFYWHPGVDPLALARAAVSNLRGGRVVSGGSTLTMQVVRLARKGRPRTFAEKAVESVLALRLSLSLSKRQVLGLYAAYAPFGGNTVGLDAAAWRYYGRDAARLSWAETATLAVLPNAPSLVHPGRNRELLLAKRNRLLDRLRERGAIDALSADLAKREPLPPAPEALPMLAPHLVARVRAERGALRFRAGDESPWVRTTLSQSVQVRATEIVARHQRALAENGVQNAAVLVLDVATGEVLAYVGNHWPPGSADHAEHVDVVPARRSTGSVLKPLLYASMLEAGELLPAQLVADLPTHIGSFHPENFDRAYAGAVPAAQALARSLNVPAVRLLRAHGVERFAAVLRRLGLSTLDRPGAHYGLALILGGAEGTLWDVTGVYAGLARSALAGTPDAARRAFFEPSYRSDRRRAPSESS